MPSRQQPTQPPRRCASAWPTTGCTACCTCCRACRHGRRAAKAAAASGLAPERRLGKPCNNRTVAAAVKKASKHPRACYMYLILVLHEGGAHTCVTHQESIASNCLRMSRSKLK